MYVLNEVPRVGRDTPWDRDTNEKLRQWREWKQEKRRVAVYLYPLFDSSTFRYRGYNMAEALEYSISWAGICFEYAELEQLKGHIREADVLILIRCFWTKELEGLVRFAQEKHIPVCYDVDDLVCCPAYLSGVCRAIGVKDRKQRRETELMVYGNQKAAALCDLMITTNGFLAGILTDTFRKKCHVLPNTLNWIQETVSADYYEQKMHKRSIRDFRIGYFSGSWTHRRDLLTALPEIREFLHDHENAVLDIYGYMELPEVSAEIKKGKICFSPFLPFEELQLAQARVDVSISPLAKSDFTDCKSELKYFEAAAVGTVTCASPSYIFSQVIEHGKDGFLCRRGEWYGALEWLCRNRDERRMRRAACEKVLTQYTERVQRKRIEDVLDEIVG